MTKGTSVCGWSRGLGRGGSRTRGGTGPAGVARIRNGRFRTEAKFGAVAGPHIARFWFFDGQGGDELSPSGRMICPEFTEPVDLPGKAVTIDFDFPRQK